MVSNARVVVFMACFKHGYLFVRISKVLYIRPEAMGIVTYATVIQFVCATTYCVRWPLANEITCSRLIERTLTSGGQQTSILL